MLICLLRVTEDSLHIGGNFLHYIIVQRPKPLCKRFVKEKRKKRDQSSSQINLCYKIVLCISPKGVASINVTWPDGCPNKRRLPRDPEQLGRYSEGSQRRLDSP